MMTEISVNNKRIAKNTLFLYFRMLLTMGVALYTSRVALQVLGVSDYGLYNVVGGVVAMLAFINGSMSSGTSRFIAYELGRNNVEKMNQVFNVSLVCHILIALICFVLAETVGLWFLNTYIQFPADRLLAVNIVYQASIITFIMQITQTPYNASIIAHENMNVYAYVSILEVSLKLLMVVFLLWVDTSDALITYSIILLFIQLLILIIYRIYCMKKYDESKWKLVKDKSIYKEIFSFSGWDVVGSLSVVTQGQGLNILLNIYFGPMVNAARAISYQVQGAFSQFTGNFMTAVVPQITKYFAQEEYKKMVKLINDSALYSFYLLLILILPLLFRLDYILGLWLEEVPEDTELFTKIILIYLIIRSLARPVVQGLHSTGNIKTINIWAIFFGLTPLPIAWIGLHCGLPASYTFYVLLIDGILCNVAEIYVLSRQFKPFSQIIHYKYVYGKSLYISVLSVIPVYIIHSLAPSGLGYFFLYYLISVSIEIILIFYLGIDKNTREKLLKIVKNKICKNGN